MRVAIIYYSRTGRTRLVAHYIRDLLITSKHQVDLYELKCVKEYGNNFLRMLTDVLLGRTVEFSGVEGYDPKNYDLLIVGTPIWVGRISPPLKSFLIKYRDIIKTDTACYTTSNFRENYSESLRSFMEGLGYKVRANASITNVEKDKPLINEFVSTISGRGLST